MAKYNLQPNESIIMKNESVLHGGVMASYTDELILTNLNIVLISKGILGNSKGIQTYPINQIKVFEGLVQVKLGKHRSGSPQLEVYFLNGQEVFGFAKKKDVQKWIENISKLLTGNAANIDTRERIEIPGVEYAAEALKGTVDTFKNAFGIQSKKQANVMNIEKVTKKCRSCMAPITGSKGQIVRCIYCDTEQNV
jgi:hypothetical protein